MSSSKRGRSLAEVMSPIDDDPVIRPAVDLAAAEAPPSAANETAVAAEAAGQSVVPINILVAPEDRRRLRQLSLDANLSLQKLGHEAWNMLLQKRGLPPLKAVTANVPSGRSISARLR
jgi:hypothetical protein